MGCYSTQVKVDIKGLDIRRPNDIAFPHVAHPRGGGGGG